MPSVTLTIENRAFVCSRIELRQKKIIKFKHKTKPKSRLQSFELCKSSTISNFNAKQKLLLICLVSIDHSDGTVCPDVPLLGQVL